MPIRGSHRGHPDLAGDLGRVKFTDEDYTVSPVDTVIVLTGSSAISIVMPDPGQCPGAHITVRADGSYSGTATITCESKAFGDSTDGIVSGTINAASEVYVYYSDGLSWHAILDPS